MAGQRQKILIPKDSTVKDAAQLEDSDFKQNLIGTLQESNSAREEMKVVLHELLRQQDTTEEIKDIVLKVDRDAVKAFWGKFGFLVWSAFVFVLGAIVSAFIGRIMGK